MSAAEFTSRIAREQTVSLDVPMALWSEIEDHAHRNTFGNSAAEFAISLIRGGISEVERVEEECRQLRQELSPGWNQ
jgi:hypothetical protein